MPSSSFQRICNRLSDCPATTRGPTTKPHIRAECDARSSEHLQDCDIINDQHAVVNINAHAETEVGGMEYDSRRRRPGTIGFPGDQNAGSTRAGHPEAGSHAREYRDADGVLYYARGNFCVTYFGGDAGGIAVASAAVAVILVALAGPNSLFSSARNPSAANVLAMRCPSR